jgi:hypothetical protein
MRLIAANDNYLDRGPVVILYAMAVVILAIGLGFWL